MKFKHIFNDDTKQLRSLLRSLRTYNKRAYKQLIFKERFEELEFRVLKDDIYIADLLTDKLFEKVYGRVKVVVEIKNEQAKILNILPTEIFLDGYKRILNTYKGCPYRDDKDLFKIKVIGGVKSARKKNKRHTIR